jgi:hypothetical protein
MGKTNTAASRDHSTPGHANENNSRGDLVENARRALAMKLSAPRPDWPENRTPGKGMKPLPNEDIAPEGALDAEGAKPALERAHKAR